MMSIIKQKSWVLVTIVFVLFATLTGLFLSSNKQIRPDSLKYDFSSPSENELDGKEAVKVSIYLLKILKFDAAVGTYQAEFYLGFECITQPCDPTQFEIKNAVSTPEIDELGDPEVGFYFYHVRANMQIDIDTKWYPFDVQKLKIEIEDKNKDKYSYILIPDPAPSGIDPEVKLTGWSAAPILRGYEVNHYYPPYNLTYSKAVFEMQAYNPFWESFLRTILPVIVLTFGGVLSFFTKTDRIADRLGIVTSSLVASVMFSLNFPNGATYISSFMLANYLILVLGLAVTVRLMALASANKTDQTKKLQSITDKMLPVLWLVAQVGFILYGFINFGR